MGSSECRFSRQERGSDWLHAVCRCQVDGRPLTHWQELRCLMLETKNMQEIADKANCRHKYGRTFVQQAILL